MKGLVRTVLVLGGAGLVVAASPWARRRFVTWGATAGEAAGTLPGDDLLPDAGLVPTRAVTIGAPPSAVCPGWCRWAAAAAAPKRTTGSKISSACDPERTLAFRSEDGAWVWIFHLRVRGAGTRRISRNRIIPPGHNRMVRALYDTVMAPGSLIMERRMLRGIKHRAEGLSGAGSAWRPGVRCG